jgi:hypothetical protein
MSHRKQLSGRFTRRGMIAGGIALAFGPRVARANGDEFFIAGQAIGNTELVYVGSVKDTDGKYVKGVSVRWEATMTGDRGDQHVGFETYTNEFGRYRTVNVARALAALDFTLDPDKVQVTAKKDGYKVKSRLHRGTRAKKMGLIEVNFTMERVAPEAAAK